MCCPNRTFLGLDCRAACAAAIDTVESARRKLLSSSGSLDVPAVRPPPTLNGRLWRAWLGGGFIRLQQRGRVLRAYGVASLPTSLRWRETMTTTVGGRLPRTVDSQSTRDSGSWRRHADGLASRRHRCTRAMDRPSPGPGGGDRRRTGSSECFCRLPACQLALPHRRGGAKPV